MTSCHGFVWENRIPKLAGMPLLSRLFITLKSYDRKIGCVPT